MNHKIEDLRNHLFETLERLKDKDNPMDLDRARTVAGVAKVIVDSAKVEVDFMKVTGSTGSGFLPQVDPPEPEAKALPPARHGDLESRRLGKIVAKR